MTQPSVRPFSRSRFLPWVGLPLLMILVTACGGGSGGSGSTIINSDNGNPPPPPATPLAGAPAGTNGIGSVIFSQGIQDPQWVTPLVVGRDAVVRVFVAAPASGNTQRPTVNVILTNALGVQTLNSLIPAPGLGIPNAPVVGNINDSWNLNIPGALVQPGTSLQVNLVADAQSTGLTQTTWPANGTPKALNPILPDNQLRITLVPVILAPAPGFPGTTGRVVTPTQTAADWVKSVRQMYPLGSGAGSLDLQVRSQPWDSGLSIVVDPADEDRAAIDTINVRDALERVRLLSSSNAFRFFAGLFTLPAGDTLLGLGDFGQPGKNVRKTFVTTDAWPPEFANKGDQFNTFAHELGHVLGRLHSPCGGAAGPDPLAPANGYLGTWGLDIATQTVKDPQQNRDIMGYCAPEWISQFTYSGLQSAMAKDQAAFTAGAAATNAIVVSGMILSNGSAVLDPFLEIMDAPYQPDPGPYTLTLYNAQHNVITTVPFDASDTTDGDGPPSFFFEVDLTPDQEVAVASATVTGPGVAAPAAQLSRAAAIAPRDPVAVTWKGGVHLGWDQGVYPEVMVRDPRSGDVIATARTGEVDLDTDAPVLELVMLDGIHTLVRSVKVGS